MSRSRGDVRPIKIARAGGAATLDLRLLLAAPANGDGPEHRPLVLRSHDPKRWYIRNAEHLARPAGPAGLRPELPDPFPRRRRVPYGPAGLVAAPDDPDAAWLDAALRERPRTRAECLPGGSNEARPCPWVGCKYHLYLDASEATGHLTVNATGELEAMPQTCALDVADTVAEYTHARGEDEPMAALAGLGVLMGLSKSRVQAIEAKALQRVREWMGDRADWLDD